MTAFFNSEILPSFATRTMFSERPALNLIAFVALFISILLPGMPALACSVVGNYKVPTTLELVEEADVIVLAKVDMGAFDKEIGLYHAVLRPVELLKGDMLPVSIEYEDAVISSDQWRATKSDPRNLRDANPDAFSGGCNRMVFDKDMLVVAFASKQEGRYIAYAPPFSRALEDVPSNDALWVKAVKLYIEIAALPRAERAEEVRSEQARLFMEIEAPDSRLLAQELERALHQTQ